jgi:hypothetical protein
VFIDSSRYAKVKIVTAMAKRGQTVNAVTLRRLPAMAGKATEVEGNDRLDTLAQRQYHDPTRFWHIADANTELQANDLVKETGRIIQVPEN